MKIDALFMLYPWIKAFHVIAMIAAYLGDDED